MADLVSYGNVDRDIHQALIVLKRGAQLLKYGRKGKTKFCPFRLSNDESSLIWISSSGERSLKLSSVSRIISGQRTAVFQSYPRPEKDHLSFSLIYYNGKRSLDLICKDKVEADVWIAGLRALISSGQGGRSKIDGWSDGGLYFDDSRDLTLSRTSDSSANASLDISCPDFSVILPNTSPKPFQPKNTLNFETLHAPPNPSNMQVKGSSSDVFRVSVSSAPSTSSQGSAPDDYDALGDVYIWGDVICENIVKVGADKSVSYVSPRADVLLPRPLESNVILDVLQIACGVKHAALVTRQGEIFTWGEESGGCLGHGVGKNVIQPHLVEALASSTVDFVACGEFHTCAVTMAGELYTWGDGTHNAGLLGHGTDVSHWVPKRIAGPLERLQVALVTCGPWHTALITSTGQLFTFGDGTFGVLGHGDRENVSYPREVESLSGLRTIGVACGVWHTAAVVEVIVTQSSTSSGKLFTWGDGDKNRLGQGDKEARLEPTCVPSLIDYNFHKIACGHSLTVGLTTSGHVFTMGSTVYGQLGNPQSDGKLPCLVEDKLSGEYVEEIACGAYHVAVLTSKNEVYTWGKGANGRLGHGDVEDRKTPTLVEALKDRHVKYISCGSNYSAAICLHKWVSGAEQSQCSTCRQAFGFTRKRHNCYNCGLVHCHSCSSRKALRAALAPNLGKLYRVCDSCYAKLNKVADASNNNRRNALPRLSGEIKDRLDKSEIRPSKLPVPSNMDLIKQLDSKAAKQGKKADTFSLVRTTQITSLLQMKDVFSTPNNDLKRTLPRPVLPSSRVSSRSVSPFSRKSSPPRSATPIPTTQGLSFSKNVTDSLKKTNKILNQEVVKLRSQVETLRQRCERQELEIQRSTKKTQEAITLAAEESSKSRAAKEVIKSLAAQLKNLAERLPPGVYDAKNIRPAHQPNDLEPNTHYPDSNRERLVRAESISDSSLASMGLESSLMNRTKGNLPGSHGTNLYQQKPGLVTSNRRDDDSDAKLTNGSGMIQARDSGVSDTTVDGRDSGNFQDDESSLASRNSDSNQIEAEWIEQYEPGVYITLTALHDGTRDLKRVRFSRRRFGEHQAEIWWSENRDKVYKRYSVRITEKYSSQAAHNGSSAVSES
ncbi:hypothetical protein TanjilG_04711 [Lupinus angustifolius]|uniref:FYVE-type domain-containing protein n=1 Tax=Lupinus angustifolius TaxID=3871 RepID=A0A4P1RK29_LUPAN|nr:PREDICTED: uncharacterized protein LOC109346766 [Lupinus angustifolius]XP_019442081.1 PREDICTED: uncharacterized protein LOC109346766 [Lupinus angustifolius]OIW12547.1 hypothetical protein TanjilG_04711 [Lupinus angustifolius]